MTLASVPTMLLAVALGDAVLVAVVLYLRRLPDPSPAFGWWGAGFGLPALSSLSAAAVSLDPTMATAAAALRAAGALLAIAGPAAGAGLRPWPAPGIALP